MTRWMVVLAAFLLLVALVGKQDYIDAKVTECWDHGEQRYDQKIDKCYKEPKYGQA